VVKYTLQVLLRFASCLWSVCSSCAVLYVLRDSRSLLAAQHVLLLLCVNCELQQVAACVSIAVALLLKSSTSRSQTPATSDVDDLLMSHFLLPQEALYL
jgi:hypothetical protein